MTAIATRSGRVIDYLNPDPAQFNLDDIAAGLARAPRYCGQTNEDWSVLQHSLLVAHLVEPEHRLHALMHDAPEAYTGDIPSPMKQAMREVWPGPGGSPYDWVERRVWLAICRRWGMAPELPAAVKHADQQAMAIEAPRFQPRGWALPIWDFARDISHPMGAAHFVQVVSLMEPNSCVAMWLTAVADELTKRKVAA